MTIQVKDANEVVVSLKSRSDSGEQVPNVDIVTLPGTAETDLAGIKAATEKVQPVTQAAGVTPSDGSDLPTAPTDALWVGSGGDIVVIFNGDASSVTISGVPTGALLPFAVKRVLSTGTTAGSIVALYN